MFWAQVQTWVLQDQCSDPGAARQSRPVCNQAGSDDPASRNERAEGRFAQQETIGSHLAVRVSLAGSMRLEAVARESGHLWRRTDDGRSTCAFGLRECPAEVLLCGHYGLAVCTEEISAHGHPTVGPREVTLRRWLLRGGLCLVAVQSSHRRGACFAKVSVEDNNGVGGVGRKRTPHP